MWILLPVWSDVLLILSCLSFSSWPAGGDMTTWRQAVSSLLQTGSVLSSLFRSSQTVWRTSSMLKTTRNMWTCPWRSPPAVFRSNRPKCPLHRAETRARSRARSRRSRPPPSCCQRRTRAWWWTRTGDTSACRPCTWTRSGQVSGRSWRPNCSGSPRGNRTGLLLSHTSCSDVVSRVGQLW